MNINVSLKTLPNTILKTKATLNNPSCEHSIALKKTNSNFHFKLHAQYDEYQSLVLKED